MEFLFALLLFLGLIIILGIIVYNKIIKLKIQVNEGWSDIQVQLKRRHDLIGNLVETVKGYATHEKETLEKVIQARNSAQKAAGAAPAEVQSAERMLSSALSGLKINALSEAYPDLKANTNFMELQRELSDTENKIAASRRFYNTTVKAFNTYIQQIPGNLFAGMAKASPADFFETDEDEKVQEVPNVNFHAKPEEKDGIPEVKPAEASETAKKEEVKNEETPKAAETPTDTPAPEEKKEEVPAPKAEAKVEVEEKKEEKSDE